MKQNALNSYSKERENLSIEQIHSILDQGIKLTSRSDLVNSLSRGGSALFPHTYITKCGDQIAAVAHACLLACQNTGKNQILVIGVLHSLTETLKEARKKEMSGTAISTTPCRGIFGPGLPNEELLCDEFSLDHFIFLIEHAAKRNGIPLPNIIIRYPNLIHGQPELIAGMKELKEVAKESIVVATSDLCHHGIAYGLPLGKALPISDQAYEFAYKVIEENLRLLSEGDLLKYRQYCLESLSDSLEVGQMLNYLLGALEGHIENLKLIDVSDLFEDNRQPSWVAAALVDLKPK